MDLRNLVLCPLVAILAIVPVIPAHADGDTALPRSRFSTPDGSVVVRSPLTNGKVEGDSTDEQGEVASVLIRYCNSLFCQYRFEQNATPGVRQHWTFDVPPDGTWQVNVRAIDTAGNMEQPGPEITIAVLAVEVPPLPVEVPVELPPLP
ncbi:MAG TPA: hypothetical protein VII47_05890, partial [Actinomycetota bacterium]